MICSRHNLKNWNLLEFSEANLLYVQYIEIQTKALWNINLFIFFSKMFHLTRTCTCKV